ncbi:MAG: bifunctional hydroxymethylpyrimidine kinase/phosphomethylpyrimidine kinase [Paracoccaceae bacterium]|nr:bifunctional hydroxymethylpyrimidine kinase/phosphomethylpyrimidine kinase [Paracoccaceae bacterium]MDE2913047.1 bifunctional hydroxymethylpyrimidine kinase/phosphomethylpyrimidine kinase [Paracoccaceae bacterium]
MTAIALTIAGSDSGGGAGIQADLKAFSAFGVYGASVITAVTAQNTCNLTAVHAVPIDVIRAQIEAVLGDLNVNAIKIGMLGMPDVIACVAEALAAFSGPVVLDPVMVAKSGATLLPEEAVAELRTCLLPRASLLTPNIPESAVLLDEAEADCDQELKSQGARLLSMGSGAVLMKAGHGTGDLCTDWLVSSDGETALNSRRVATRHTHGTGCSYSSAIAAGLARGHVLETAVRSAHDWLHQAIVRAGELRIGRGNGPVHHFHGIWT